MLNVGREISRVMIGNMTNSKKFVEISGVKDLTIYVLIWLALKNIVKSVYSMKAKTQMLNAFLKVKRFDFFYDVSN